MTAGRRFLGSWPPVNFQDRAMSSFKRPLFKPIELEDMTAEDGSDDSSSHRREKKRRLTAEQVQFLEKSFESENKLEPDRKFQLAKVLGVEQRQIAIWFQNRRARWRTKQLEDCEALRSSYGSLKADHECLLKEKQKLEAKVLFLTEKLLLKERNGGSEPFELIKHPESSLNAGIKPSNSTILDFRSPPPYADEDGCCMLMELAGSANALKLSNFDGSQIGELDDANDYSFLGLDEDIEDDNSCSYGLLW
ncbi:homeobox-leucine zipper protein HOX5-like [Zingiber officinale]|uniref:Homeobox-leucine zipper protein n=1 Tax=Zingiber officinale TaxID=94328 RepID=A0A8J5M0B4_ZINOF|nr:homeobox-leucine zipper protein HOX5-like [Zingiber officinale]KAG6530072.1 hypothetical protein ZIOFF_012293 [Zingiber officinale]